MACVAMFRGFDFTYFGGSGIAEGLGEGSRGCRCQIEVSWNVIYCRWTPDPVIVTIRDNGAYIHNDCRVGGST